MTSIYEAYEQYLPLILEDFTQKIKTAALEHKKTTSFKLFEHFHARIKTADSMAEKCQRKNLPLSSESALKQIRDAIGIRIITGFVDDIYQIIDFIRQMPGIHIFKEKDYINQVKPNGYRSYHLILEVETPYPDCHGKTPGKYFIEV